MIRLKNGLDFKILEKYGFKYQRGYRSPDTYRYSISWEKDYHNQFQSLTVYVDTWKNAYGETIRQPREVAIGQHAYKVDGIIEILFDLIEIGIFERIKAVKL